MKRIIISALAAASLAAAVTPALAQPYGGGPRHGYSYGQGGGGGINAQQQRIERRIDQGLRNGSLTRREAFQLRAQLRNIEQLEWRYRRTGGLNNWERRDLDRRLDNLSRRVFAERHDWQNRRYR